jgi:hypothetical protein
VKTLINKKTVNISINNILTVIYSCRGRDRTSTRQLAIAQSSVVDPGRPDFHRNGSTLRLSCYPHPRDKRACLPKFHHPTIFKNYYDANLICNPLLKKYFNKTRKNIEIIQE